MDSDFITNLSNMIKNGNIPGDVKEKLNAFMSNNSTNNSNTSNTNENASSSFNFNDNKINNDYSESTSSPNIDINTLLKIKSIMDKINSSKNDPRSNLLLSLKPYLKESRKSKVEQYIQLLNMTKIMEDFNENGGEKTK